VEKKISALVRDLGGKLAIDTKEKQTQNS